MTDRPRLSIVIVCWNNREDLGPCLESLVPATASIDAEVILSDNGSTDDSRELAASFRPRLRMKILDHGENLGFARANNRGIEAAQGEHVLLLNPDTEVHPDALERALAHMDRDPAIGLLGGRLLTSDGAVQVPCIMTRRTLWDELCIDLGLHRVFQGNRLFDRHRMGWHDFDRAAEPEAVGGAFMFIRRALIDEIGGLDADLFLYAEEEDYGRRTRAAGWKVFYAPDVEVTHHGGTTTATMGSAPKLHYYESWDTLTRKHYGVAGRLAFRTIRLLGLLLRLAADVVRPGDPARRAVLKQAVRIQLGLPPRQKGAPA